MAKDEKWLDVCEAFECIYEDRYISDSYKDDERAQEVIKTLDHIIKSHLTDKNLTHDDWQPNLYSLLLIRLLELSNALANLPPTRTNILYYDW